MIRIIYRALDLGKFAICLEYQNKILMSYIFGHCYFGKGKYECEVIRGATELGYTIVRSALARFGSTL